MSSVTIMLRIKKELDYSIELKVIKLKGSIISRGYTEIIHISDEDDQFYLNSFSAETLGRKSAEIFISEFIKNHGLENYVMIL